MLVSKWNRGGATRVREIEALVGSEATRLAVVGHRVLLGGASAAALGLASGLWLESRGPGLLWIPLSMAGAAFISLFITSTIIVRSMTRAASQYVSGVLGYQVTVTCNQHVLRKSAWEQAIERAKRVHEREAAGKPQRWHL